MMLERLEGFEKMENDPTADRNREPSEPDSNMNVDDDGNEEMEGDNDAFEEDEFDEEFGPQEFSALNSQLDQLQSALDSLESRNDDIHSKLLELLRSSREIRQVMTAENNQNRVGGEAPSNNEANNTSGGASSNSSSSNSGGAGKSSTETASTSASVQGDKNNIL